MHFVIQSEQVFRQAINRLVGALRRQNNRNNELKLCFIFELAFGFRICPF